MSIAQKVALVRTAVPARGLRPALASVGLARATWYYYQCRRRAYGSTSSNWSTNCMNRRKHTLLSFMKESSATIRVTAAIRLTNVGPCR
jgi:hypothetical protein